MLFYDIALTMGEEIEYIWNRKFSFFTLLWLLVRSQPLILRFEINSCIFLQNRYLTPLGSVVIIVCKSQRST